MDRFRGAIVGTVVGAAAGAAAEQGTWAAVPMGAREAEMCATAQCLVERGGVDLPAIAALLARRSSEAAEQGDGRLLERLWAISGGHDPSHLGLPTLGLFDLDAAVRCVPVVLAHIAEPQEALDNARAVARLTHAHPIGEDGARQHAAVLRAFALHPTGEPVDAAEVFDLAKASVRTRRFRDVTMLARRSLDADPDQIRRVLGDGPEAHRSIPTAIVAVLREPRTFVAAVTFATELGGERRGLGALAGGLAGALHGVADIPERWLADVDPDGALSTLADRLCALARARASVQ